MTEASATLIENLIVVTMDDDRRILDGASIAIRDDKIAAINVDESIADSFSDANKIDGSGMVAIPGLIDTHSHADQSLLRGLGDCMHWIPFLDDVIDPWLAKRDPQDGVLANTLSMIEMVRGGTTCFVSPNVDPRDNYEALTDVIGQIGIRAVLGRFTMANREPDSAESAQRAVSEAIAIMRDWHGSQSGLVQMWFGLDVPRRPGDDDYPEFYKAIAQASQAEGLGIVYHFCSEIEDAEYIEAHYGMRPAEWSRDNYALGENVLLINGCQMSPLEIELLAESGTHLAHSPVANMKMATGILPLPDVLHAGVNVSLGTDGALNNNSYDMFAEMKTACLLQNSVRRNASAMTADKVLEMATINGARAIGRDSELGSLEEGKLADIVLVDLRRPNMQPVHDVVSNLVFSANASNVHSVFVAGRKVVEEGRTTGVNADEVVNAARDKADALRTLINDADS